MTANINSYSKQLASGVSWGTLFLSTAWYFKSNFDFEPLIVLLGSIIGIIFTFDKTNKDFNVKEKYFPIYEKSDSTEFHEYLGNLMRSSEKIVLIGMGLNILNNEPLRLEIMKRFATSNRKLEIFMANPFGIYTERRFIEEETGDDKPSIGKKGIISKVQTLIKNWKNLGEPKNIELRLFENYLSFALFIVDKDYFFYPYAFAKTGNYSPVFHFLKLIKEHNKVIDFLDAQHKDIRNASKNAVEYFNIKIHKNSPSSSIFPLAIYFVPAFESDFYSFGSEVLGYDIYHRKTLKSPFDNQLIGGARDYGFHLTICDAIYFQNLKELREVEEELEFILEDFSSFYLQNLKLTSGFPNNNTIAIRCIEPTGTLSAIHFELVNRVYRKSIGSNYTFGKANMDRPEPSHQKQKFYTNRYNAPYILDEYKPHFTLANGLEKSSISSTMNSLSKLFSSKVKGDRILVDKIAILLYDEKKSQWYIHKNINLKNK